jgi:hypothetical protein
MNQVPSEVVYAVKALTAIDTDGNFIVTQSEVNAATAAFQATYGKSAGESGFNSSFDVDSTNKVDSGDWSYITPVMNQSGFGSSSSL